MKKAPYPRVIYPREHFLMNLIQAGDRVARGESLADIRGDYSARVIRELIRINSQHLGEKL